MIQLVRKSVKVLAYPGAQKWWRSFLPPLMCWHSSVSMDSIHSFIREAKLSVKEKKITFYSKKKLIINNTKCFVERKKKFGLIFPFFLMEGISTHNGKMPCTIYFGWSIACDHKPPPPPSLQEDREISFGDSDSHRVF